MATRVFRLRMTAPLHVGEAGVGYEETLSYVPSDTLFSALVVTWLHLGAADRVAQLATLYEKHPPLLISSAMPYAGPFPLFPKPHLPKLPSGLGKAFKRVRWVSAAVFQRLLDAVEQEALAQLWLESQETERNVQNGEVWLLPEEETLLADTLNQPDQDLQIWQPERVPRVALDRGRQASTLYHVGRVHFAAEGGLWVAARGDEEWLQLTESALHLLGDSGIGGLRSQGHGAFTCQRRRDWESLPDLDGDYEILLSRTAPAPVQMERLRAPGSSYELVTVGGWSGTGADGALVRQRVNLLAEGSVIARGDGVAGQLVDVKPPKAPPIDHPIYRYGYGFGVPIRLHAQMLEEDPW